jgi:DNA-binding XRE family transcriptional regulator
MNYLIKLDEYRLKIFHESRKRRTLVGELIYDKENDRYELIYNKKYAHSKNAIPISPHLNLFKLHHQSEKGKLFPSFIDRIPDKSNPAYSDYCKAQGISPDEKNPIILLGSIGKRGPSSFIFEPVYYSEFNSSDITSLREQLHITQYDLAKALDISQTTLQRIESGASRDLNTLKYMQILLKFPEIALWQLKQTGNQVHKDVSTKLINYFQSKANNMSPIKSFILYANKEYQSIANKKAIPAHGSFQVAFAINNTFENIAISETLLHKLKSSNPRPSEWPLWVVLQNSLDEKSRPKRLSDRWQAFIYGSNHLDFWMVTEKKCFYHYRALEDDLSDSTTQQAKAAKLNELDFVWQIQNICDAITTGLAFTRALNGEEKTLLSFVFKWTGLKNRFLTSWAHNDRHIDSESKSNVDECTYEINIPVNASRENVVNYTYEIASHLFLTFGGYDRIARDTIAGIVINYLK